MTSPERAHQDGQRSVCVVLVDRANYGRLKPAMLAINEDPRLQIQVLAGGTLVLDRFQRPVDIVQRDGFTIDGEVFMEIEGNRPVTMAKSIGLGVVEFASEFQRLQPDVVLIIGDRFEALAAAVAAAYSNICLVHVQGGEVSGSIDESARHAISKLAHYHIPSTTRAANYLIRMGERPDTILTVGCPSSDLALSLDASFESTAINAHGSGAEISLDAPYLLVAFHPTTTRYGDERQEINALLDALAAIAMPAIMLWPNIDAGADHISKAIRMFRERESPPWLRLLKNLAPEDYLRVLSKTACAVGNSSSFVRDAGFFGTPVVLLGDRQIGRQWGDHVRQIPVNKTSIVSAVQHQISHGAYAISKLYGDGQVGPRIAEALAVMPLYTQKHLQMDEPTPPH